MYEREQIAWQALGRLMDSSLPTLQIGHLDAVGEQNYSASGKKANVPGQAVKDLQILLAYATKQDSLGLADGAFGDNTAQLLEKVSGRKSFEPKVGLPLFATLIGKMVVNELEEAVKLEQPGRVDLRLGDIVPMVVHPIPRHFCQADPRWAEEHMGPKTTFKKGGCALACMSMLFNWFARRKNPELNPQAAILTPLDVDRWMDNNGGYLDGTSLIVWKRMEDYCRDMVGEEVVYQQDGYRDAPLTHEEGMARAREFLTRRNQPIILRVQNRQFNGGNWFNHFVLGVQVKDNEEIGFLDPRNGVGGDLNHEQNDTAQTVNKGGYNVVGIEQYILRELV